MSSIPTQHVAFDDTATSAMGEAFDKACKSLRSFGTACTVREIIAKRIISAAENGERDPARLHQQALIPFGIEDMSMLVVSVGRDPPRPSLCFGHAATSVILESPAPPPGFLFAVSRIRARRVQDAGAVVIIWGASRSV